MAGPDDARSDGGRAVRWKLVEEQQAFSKLGLLSRDNRRPPERRRARSQELGMDLGIAGRKAIVCASSRGLGYACAKALAQAGCEVVINGRGEAKLAAPAAELKKATGGKVIAVT